MLPPIIQPHNNNPYSNPYSIHNGNPYAASSMAVPPVSAMGAGGSAGFDYLSPSPFGGGTMMANPMAGMGGMGMGMGMMPSMGMGMMPGMGMGNMGMMPGMGMGGMGMGNYLSPSQFGGGILMPTAMSLGANMMSLLGGMGGMGMGMGMMPSMGMGMMPGMGMGGMGMMPSMGGGGMGMMPGMGGGGMGMMPGMGMGGMGMMPGMGMGGMGMGMDPMMTIMNMLNSIMSLLMMQSPSEDMMGSLGPMSSPDMTGGSSPSYSLDSPSDFKKHMDTIGNDPYQAGEDSQASEGSQVFDPFESFETEGNNPYMDDGTEHYNAFESSVVTPNGNGIRNENKIPEEDRVAMANTNESLTGTVTPELSAGSQAIITQWHGEGEGALVKLYVDDQDADVQTAGAENGVAGDGIFDVYIVYHDESGDPVRVNLGTTESGQPMDLAFEKRGNEFTADVNGVSTSFSAPDDEEVYLKYGMYLQTKDPLTGEKAKPNEGGMEILERNGITHASATFENLVYNREVI